MAIYGIDLGTTNSLIGLHSDNYLSEMVPSCVNLETGQAGKEMFERLDTKRSFKIDMSMSQGGLIPIQASYFVLKELKRQVPKNLPAVKDVVISVPAYFSDEQRTATIEAAKKADLNVKALVNEPTAAAMYIAADKKNLFVVYDLGGGTFDCSIIDSRFGIYDVQATSGCAIGGDNFDRNIMKFLIKYGKIPITQIDSDMRMKLQHFAMKRKLELQKKQSDITVDLTEFGGDQIIFTVDNYKEIMKITFNQTINVMKRLINQTIPQTDYYEILLVGGSTHCPYLQEWITDVTGEAPQELTYNPDYVVGQGAALYADLLEKGEVAVKVSDVTKGLSIALSDGTCENIVPPNSKIPLKISKMFLNPVDTEKLVIDLCQGESVLVKDNDIIGSLVWDYNCLKRARTGNVKVEVTIDANGVITLTAGELLKKPVSVTIQRK